MLSARDDRSGAAVDWWFMYKLPRKIGPESGPKTKGNEYVYYDPTTGRPLALSPNKLGDGAAGAFYHTLDQIYASPEPSSGWIPYNDEYPESLSINDELPESMTAAERLEKLLAKQKEGVCDWPPNVPINIHGDSSRAKDRSKPVDHPHNGHNKGILAFDLKTDTAFWLSHSTPRIPGLHIPADVGFYYPDYAWQYAQTFICITLDSVKTACAIADVMSTQHEPQVYGCQLPEGVTEDSEWGALWKLAQGSLPPNYGKHYAEKHEHREPADITFQSKGGKEFRLIAKSGAWFDDFWIDLVEPKLGADLRVETWRRLTPSAMLPGEDVNGDGKIDYGDHDFSTTYKGRDYHHEFLAKDGKHVVDEVTTVNLGVLEDSDGNPLTGYIWDYTHDHAKWGISEATEYRGEELDATDPHKRMPDCDGTESDWVCVADINRMTSQEKRGGGAVCFHEPLLWHCLNQIERISGKIT